LLKERDEMVKRASNIAKHSVVNEEADGGKLLNIETSKSGIKK
jgi:hypothetical protein